MNNLAIKSISITDSAEQLATDCTLELVSVEAVEAMPAEFSLPGDSQTLTASSLRPTGQRVNINLSYGNTPSYTAFSGVIEHVDDMEDADKFIYNMTLSNLPQGYPQRNMVSALYNQILPLVGYTDVTAYYILQDVCNRAGLYLGRVDFPDYNVWGNFEVVRKTPVEVAQELIAPFLKFDFLKYVVRCDNNGLQVIGYDYTQGAQTPNAHTISNYISKKKSFSIYNPEHRIGPSDVLITGGDIYGNNGAYTATGYCYKIFSQSSKDISVTSSPPTGAAPLNPPNASALPNVTNWTESDTLIVFLIDMTINSPNDPRIEAGLTFSDLLDTNVAALEAGACDSIKVRESYAIWEVIKTFDSIIGKTQEVLTQHTYDMFTFNNGVFHDGSQPNQCVQGVPGYNVSQIKETQTVTTTTAFTSSGPYPVSMTKTWYKFAPDGALLYQNTGTYYNSRGTWILQSMQENQGSLQEATTALIQFFDNIRTIDEPDAVHGAKTEIGKYQLRNGTIIAPIQLQRLPCPLSPQGERDRDFVINNAFQMEGPFMDYNGLNLLWNLAQREQQLERLNAYWEIIDLVTTIDTSAVVGESIILDGSGGIVDNVDTTIDADQALTTIKIKRIVYSTAGETAPESLNGQYISDPYAAVLNQTPSGVTSIAFPSASVGSVSYPYIQTIYGIGPLAAADLPGPPV
jgi:hypothetical protein